LHWQIWGLQILTSQNDKSPDEQKKKRDFSLVFPLLGGWDKIGTTLNKNHSII
jgi:hypothetical protein